jgi:hypothetical protein
MIIGLTIFSWDLAAIGALTLVFYILTGVITEKEAFAIMPMSVIFLITGTGVLISMIVTLGGFDLIMSALEPMLNSVTAAPIVTAIAGMLSWVSSAVGVVIPTMTPMAPGIAAQVGGVSSVAIASAVSCGSHMAALSPFSGGGGYVMSFTSPHVTEHERKKMIPTLLVAAFSSLVMGSLMGLVGFYNLF